LYIPDHLDPHIPEQIDPTIPDDVDPSVIKFSKPVNGLLIGVYNVVPAHVDPVQKII